MSQLIFSLPVVGLSLIASLTALVPVVLGDAHGSGWLGRAANSSQRFVSGALSMDTCRLIRFARWISAGGKGLSKRKFTLGRKSKSRDEGMAAESWHVC